jgi:hypothetical protein
MFQSAGQFYFSAEVSAVGIVAVVLWIIFSIIETVKKKNKPADQNPEIDQSDLVKQPTYISPSPDFPPGVEEATMTDEEVSGEAMGLNAFESMKAKLSQTPRPKKNRQLKLLKSSKMTDLQKAVIFSEVLEKPVSLRRTRP